MSWLSEEAWSECKRHNKMLEAAGVTDLEFSLNISGDYVEIAVSEADGYLTTWFHSWEEAEKFCKTKRPNAYWETTGW